MQQVITEIKQFQHQPLNFPDFKAVTGADGGRYYEVDTGVAYPSVTTVLSAMSDKSHLYEWRKRVGEEKAAEITARSTSRGTKLHKLCEDYVQGVPEFHENVTKAMPTTLSLFRQVKPILDERVNLIHNIEFCVRSDKLKTAGRCDLICELDGIKTILDYKTSTKYKREDWIRNYFIQCTTYALGVYEMTGVVCPQIAVLIAVEEGDKPQLFVRRAVDYIVETKDIFTRYHAKVA